MYECDCKEGFLLREDGYSCYEINSTSSPPSSEELGQNSEEDIFYQKDAVFDAVELTITNTTDSNGVPQYVPTNTTSSITSYNSIFEENPQQDYRSDLLGESGESYDRYDDFPESNGHKNHVEDYSEHSNEINYNVDNNDRLENSSTTQGPSLEQKLTEISAEPRSTLPISTEGPCSFDCGPGGGCTISETSEPKCLCPLGRGGDHCEKGLQQKEIIALLKNIHNITVHPRTLKRIMQRQNLFRRKNYSSIEIVASFVQDQLSKSGQLHGYRWMHLKCIQHGLTVTRDTVRELLSLLDPRGVDLRKRRRLRRRQYYNSGPNNVWHMDSYDKLKPYGICINGAIDGFSRHIIWLNAGRTSNDPKVISGYYLNAIKVLGGCPMTVRSDMGTENVVVEKTQTSLRELFVTNENNKPAFLYGRSTSNQRIESWWSVLRKHSAQYWMNLFEILRDEGLYNGTFVDKSLIQFCFLNMIQDELDQVALEWNFHAIRSTKNNRSPIGKPVMMYQAPNLYGAETSLISIPQSVISCLEEECTYYSSPCNEDMNVLCKELISENGFNLQCDDPYDAVKLYVNLREKVYDIISY